MSTMKYKSSFEANCFLFACQSVFESLPLAFLSSTEACLPLFGPLPKLAPPSPAFRSTYTSLIVYTIHANNTAFKSENLT
jgi:hypothetical protein